jgi:hypothetical protein
MFLSLRSGAIFCRLSILFHRKVPFVQEPFKYASSPEEKTFSGFLGLHIYNCRTNLEPEPHFARPHKPAGDVLGECLGRVGVSHSCSFFFRLTPGFW